MPSVNLLAIPALQQKGMTPMPKVERMTVENDPLALRLGGEPSLAAVLADPIIGLLMRRDGVTVATLEALALQLRTLAANPPRSGLHLRPI